MQNDERQQTLLYTEMSLLAEPVCETENPIMGAFFVSLSCYNLLRHLLN
jgi:hypothetical protein